MVSSKLGPMKKLLRVLLAAFILPGLMLLISGPPAVSAAEVSPENGPVRKLQRGFLNVALSPFELSNQFSKEKKVESFIPSWFRAFGFGSYLTVQRAAIGVYEMVTFPVPLPASYEPVLSPEFAWELTGTPDEIPASVDSGASSQ